MTIYKGDAYYQNLVNEVTDMLKMPRIPIYYGNISNAMATTMIDRNGRSQRIIVYNPDFMYNLYEYSEWAVFAVIAHEVAHHYNKDVGGRLFGKKSGIDMNSHIMESNADYLAGWVLKCKGATIPEAMAMYYAIDFQESRTHPSEEKRVKAMTAGWRDANCAINPPRRITPRTQPKNDNSALAGFGVLALLFVGLVALSK